MCKKVLICEIADTLIGVVMKRGQGTRIERIYTTRPIKIKKPPNYKEIVFNFLLLKIKYFLLFYLEKTPII